MTHESLDDNGVALYFAKGEIGILLNSSTTVGAVATTEIYGDRAPSELRRWALGAVPHPPDAVPLRMIRLKNGNGPNIRRPSPPVRNASCYPAAFVDYILGARIDLEEGRVTVEMLIGAYRSAAEGRRVQFPLN